MARSPMPLFLLLALSAVVPAALAIPPGGGGDALAKACNGTSTLESCVNVINSNPDGATPRRLAELAYTYLVKDGEALYKETQAAAAAAATKDEAAQTCANELNGNMKYYYNSLSRFAPEQGDDKFAQAKSNLDELLNSPSNTGVSCSDRDIDKEPFVRKMYSYESMLEATQSLMKAADSPPKTAAAPAA